MKRMREFEEHNNDLIALQCFSRVSLGVMMKKNCTIASLLTYLISSVTAAACSPPAGWSEAKAVEAAKEIFTAHVTKAELSPVVLPFGDGDKGRYFVQVHYELGTTIKGQPTQSGPVSTTTFYIGGCGVPFAVGVDYLLFVEPFTEETPESIKAASSGMVSIFNTQSIWPGSDEESELLTRLESLVEEAE